MVESLIAAIIALSFQMPIDQARIHAEAAVRAAQEYKTKLHMSEADAATLLLGMAYLESRYDSTALSRLEKQPRGGYKRVTGTWAGEVAPPHARAPWFCGPLQTGGNVSWDECRRMREDVAYGYQVGAQELAQWMADPTCHAQEGQARLVCALRGYGGGYAAIRAEIRYPANVLWAMGRIQQFAAFAEKRRLAPRS